MKLNGEKKEERKINIQPKFKGKERERKKDREKEKFMKMC